MRSGASALRDRSSEPDKRDEPSNKVFLSSVNSRSLGATDLVLRAGWTAETGRAITPTAPVWGREVSSSREKTMKQLRTEMVAPTTALGFPITLRAVVAVEGATTAGFVVAAAPRVLARGVVRGLVEMEEVVRVG